MHKVGKLLCRGIRGATTVAANTKEAILEATRELIQELTAANRLEKENVAAVFFTLTPDLNAVFPAEGARQLGWDKTAMLCVQELPVPGSLPRCIRILILYNTDLPQERLNHVYLKQAQILRPDITSGNNKGDLP
jgi:chorismate mutase